MRIVVIKLLFRIYTPFICAIVSLIHGVFFLTENLTEDFAFNASVTSGYSFIVVGYFWSTSNRMCIWWKLNLVSLLLTGISALLNYYKFLSIDMHFYLFTFFSSAALLFFLLYRVHVGLLNILTIK